MDYGYILAEELVLREEFYDAFILLEQIIKMEYSYSYFYIFFPEVINFTLTILKRNIDGVLSDELALFTQDERRIQTPWRYFNCRYLFTRIVKSVSIDLL